MVLKRTSTVLIVPAIFGLAILALWGFPALWYSRTGGESKVWFAERREVEGWKFDEIPISASAERLLVADQTVKGEFRSGIGEAIRVFSAKRYVENPNEIGLFVHTPDRCWVEGGWRIEPILPAVREVELHGTTLTMERRLFRIGTNKELVYFCGLVDGGELPYRLDHNLSRSARIDKGFLRPPDRHFWERLWGSFTSRRQLSGAKQFVRISTPVTGDDITASDARLEDFLGKWLAPGDFGAEKSNWETARKPSGAGRVDRTIRD